MTLRSGSARWPGRWASCWSRRRGPRDECRGPASPRRALQVPAFAVAAVREDDQAIHLAARQGRPSDGFLKQRRSLAGRVIEGRAAEALLADADPVAEGLTELAQVRAGGGEARLPSRRPSWPSTPNHRQGRSSSGAVQLDVELPFQAGQHHEQQRQQRQPQQTGADADRETHCNAWMEVDEGQDQAHGDDHGTAASPEARRLRCHCPWTTS